MAISVSQRTVRMHSGASPAYIDGTTAYSSHLTYMQPTYFFRVRLPAASELRKNLFIALLATSPNIDRF